MATKAEKQHFDRLARFGCILCFYIGYGQGTPAEIHHIRRAGKRSDAPVIPLCPIHHRGNAGIHGLGRRAFEDYYRVTEEDLLNIINEAINYQWENVDGGYISHRIQ